MRSRASSLARNRLALAATLVFGCALLANPSFAQTQEGAPTADEVAAAIETVRADPNLTPERKTRALRWRSDSQPQKPGEFAQWIRGFFVWLAQLSRVLVWVIGGLLAIALIWALVRTIRGLSPTNAPTPSQVPTHVRDLDIRPESLPDDVGAAALELWERGQHRAALSLLYRGLLSRLAHVHLVPIRDATTEGDCLGLAATHLQGERRDYVAVLIGVWQRATYGGREPDEHEVQSLCSGFEAALSAPSPSGVEFTP